MYLNNFSRELNKFFEKFCQLKAGAVVTQTHK